MGVADVGDDMVRPRVLRDPGSVHWTGEAFLMTVLAVKEQQQLYRTCSGAVRYPQLAVCPQVAGCGAACVGEDG